MKNMLMVAVAALFVGGFAHAAEGDTSKETTMKSEQNADGSMAKKTTTESHDADGKKHSHTKKMKKNKDGETKSMEEKTN